MQAVSTVTSGERIVDSTDVGIEAIESWSLPPPLSHQTVPTRLHRIRTALGALAVVAVRLVTLSVILSVLLVRLIVALTRASFDRQ